MVGENGTPETPDWVCEPRVLILDLTPRIKPAEPSIPDSVTLGEN